jgi:hypothetical protein
MLILLQTVLGLVVSQDILAESEIEAGSIINLTLKSSSGY